MRRLIPILLLLAVIMSGCSTSDPYPESFYTSGSYARVASDGSGGYWHEHDVDGVTVSPGGSGATFVVPGVNTLGGYQLDAANEYLYFDISIEDNYDEISDAEIQIYYELNVDNTGGAETDLTVFNVLFYCKQLSDTASDVHELNVIDVVGTAPQYALRVAVGECTPVTNSIITFRLRLDTVNSDIDNVTVNYVKLRYPSYYAALERD